MGDSQRKERNRAWQAVTAADKDPRQGKKTAGRGEEGSGGPQWQLWSWGPKERRQQPWGYLGRTFQAEGTARTKALSPRDLWGWEGSRAQGEHQNCLVGWGSPAASLPLATTNRDSGKLPVGAPGPRTTLIADGGTSPLLSCGRETRGTPAPGAPARGLGGLQFGGGWWRAAQWYGDCRTHRRSSSWGLRGLGR